MIRVEKATADLELNLTKDAEGFYEYVNSKRKTRENMNSLLNGAGELVRKDAKKPRYSVSCVSLYWCDRLQESQAPQVREKI